MNTLRNALVAACLLAAAATPALAAKPILTSQVASTPLPAGMFMIDTFDSPIAAGFTLTGGGYIRSGALGVLTGMTAPPPGDVTNYLTVAGGKAATLVSVKPLKKISLFMGSPDSYNSIRFIGLNYDVTLNGSQLWQPLSASTGDRSWGRRLTYDFGAFGVTKVIFASRYNSLEFDDLAGAFQAVPEPTSWALMLVGFFGLGAILRYRRAVPAA